MALYYDDGCVDLEDDGLPNEADEEALNVRRRSTRWATCRRASSARTCCPSSRPPGTGQLALEPGAAGTRFGGGIPNLPHLGWEGYEGAPRGARR